MGSDQDIVERNRRAQERAKPDDRRVPRAYTAADLGEAGQTMADAEKLDMVSSPPHYRQGGIECIDAIEAALTPEEFRGYCKGNALKYCWRLGLKGDRVEDAQKAVWYLNRMEKVNGP